MFEPNKNVFITHDIKERGRMNSNKVRKSEVLDQVFDDDGIIAPLELVIVVVG